MMAEAKLLPANALEKNAPKVVPPLAGFWFRLGALALDIILIRLALQATFPALRPMYLSMGASAIVVGPLVALVYLLLAEGPVGKGMTLGKAIVGIRTTDFAGRQPSLGAAAIRTSLLLVLALPLLGGEMAARMAAQGDAVGLFVAGTLVKGLATAFIIANVFLVVLHPLKQTVHDLLARTLVVREAGAHNLADFLEQVEGQVAPLHRRAVRVAAIAFLALGAINMFGDYRQISSAEGKRYLGFTRSFGREFRYGPFRPDYRGAMFGWVESRVASDGITSGTWALRMAALAKSGDRPTSQSHTVVFEMRSSSAVARDDLGTSEALAALGARALAWTEQQIKADGYPLDRQARSRSETIFQPRHLALLFVENVDLLFYRQTRVVHAEILPLGIARSFYAEEEAAIRKAAEAAISLTTNTATVPAGADRPSSGGTAGAR